MKIDNLHKIYKSPLLYILIFALAIHMYFLIKNPGSVFHEPEIFGKEVSTYGSLDASKYVKMAWQLLHDGIYGYAESKPNAFVTPGQPFYLAAIFQISEWIHVDHLLLAKLINMFLNLGIISIIYAISKVLFKNVYISIISSLLYTTYFSSYHFFRTTLTEIPSIFFFMLSILIFLLVLQKDSFRLHVIFGIVAAITLMFRPTPAPLLLIAWGIIIYSYGLKKAIKIGFIWCIGPLLIMGPWVIRNFIVFGHAYLFSSHAGDPLLSGANPFNLYNEDNMIQDMLNAGYSLSSEDKASYAKHLIKEGFYNDFALWFSWFTVGKTITLFNNPDGTYLYWSYFKPWVIDAFKNQHLFVVLTGLLGSITLRKNKKVLLFSSIIWGYIALSNIFLVILRYGFFIIPCICIISGCFLVYSFSAIYKKLTTLKKA
ncbi:ArnT family glycosyltransferase [Bacillus sp. CGMCC 1.60114]|uniref:ArnT family glycosyltransferase n=1 Tax=unclassified Bacillus (in: firmicutes) TaxID=185979 RepID=UPI00363924EC